MHLEHDQIGCPRPVAKRKRRGAATVEFALTAPVVFMFFFTALEFGRYNMIHQSANNAAYEAARKCIVPSAKIADAQAVGQAVLGAVGIKGATVGIVLDPTDTEIQNTTRKVTVTVTIPVASNLWITPMFTSTAPVVKKCTMTRDWVYSAR